MALAQPIPVRLTDDAERALASLQRGTRVNKATLIRLAVAAGLPLIAAKFGPAKPSPKKPNRQRGSSAR